MDFDTLFEDFYPALVRYCYRLVEDGDAAEDLAQEAFVRLHEHEVSGEPPGIRAWLFKVATHLARDRARVRKNRERLLAEHPVRPSAPPAPDAEAERTEEVHAARRALAALDRRSREVLLMREEGFSYREIAEAVGVAPGSVGTLLARARTRFERVYTTQGIEE